MTDVDVSPLGKFLSFLALLVTMLPFGLLVYVAVVAAGWWA